MNQILRDGLIRDDVRNSKPSARLRNAEHFTEDLALVRRQVDHAIGNDQINRAVRYRHGVSHAFPEFHIGRGVAKIAGHDHGVPARDLQHRIRHVDADHMARRTNETRRLETVDPAARPDVEDRLTGAHGFQPCGRAAAIGNLEDLFGDEGLEMPHVIASWTTHLLSRAGRPGVSIADGLSNGLSWHGSPR